MTLARMLTVALFFINLIVSTPNLPQADELAGDWGNPVGQQFDGSLDGDWGDPVG